MAKFGLYGKIAAQPGRREELLGHLLRAAELMEEADGCDLYAVGTSATEEDVIWVAEIWQSESDHDASLSIEGVRELIVGAKPLIESMGESNRVQVVGGKGVQTP